MSSTTAGPRLDDAVVDLDEADHSFGTGPLRLRILHVDWLAPVWFDGELWYEVAGVEVGSVDDNGGPDLRICVRGRKLPRRR